MICGPIQIGDSQRQLVKKKKKQKQTVVGVFVFIFLIYLFIYLFFRQPKLEVQTPTTRTLWYSKFKMQSTYRIS